MRSGKICNMPDLNARIKQLIYLINARLPTEKAHGYQICKMCEAFALNGVKVSLVHPYRRQSDAGLVGRTVFDYYGVKHVFKVQTLKNWDVVLLDRFIPARIFTPIFFAHAFIWGCYAASVARGFKADLYFTRDSAVAFWLVRMGLPTVYEAHVDPKRAQRWLLKTMVHHPALRLVVVLTSFLQKRFMQLGFSAEKVIVLPDGVDLDLFQGLSSKADCRRRLGLPLDRPIIGYIRMLDLWMFVQDRREEDMIWRFFVFHRREKGYSGTVEVVAEIWRGW